jgi:hypothetical protein
MTERICTSEQAASLLDSLKSEWNKISEADRLDCMYILQESHEETK